MYLKKFIYVNWGNIPHAEFDFGPVNLFSGGNGSGKTTAADAIQTIMTAAHDTLFQFNPGQDESTQRGRGGKQVRTLASYVLGCDDGAYARPHPCDGYLAAVFAPTPGEDAEPFTAVIAQRAWLESSGQQRIARLEETTFYILPDVQLALKDLVREDQGGRYVVSVETIYTLLRSEFSAASVEKYDKKKAYLCRLYGILRGRDDAVSEREALNAARAFSRFMAYKPIRGIDEFVASEVLEPRDLGDAIRDVAAMLKRIHTMERDARELRDATVRLQTCRDSAASYIDQWLELQSLHYGRARHQYSASQQLWLAEKNRRQQLQTELDRNQREAEISEGRRQEIRAQLLEVEALRLQVPALRDKDQLEQSVSALEGRIRAIAAPLLVQDQQVRQHREAAAAIARSLRKTAVSLDISALGDRQLHTLTAEIASEVAPFDLPGLFNRDWIDISPLEAHLDTALALQQRHNQWVDLFLHNSGEHSLRGRVAQEWDKRQQHSERLQRQVQAKETDIATLEARRVTYPRAVREALDEIRRLCPQADARVLCDHVEITDSAWQSALEGYIGGARFGIIVEPEFEADAIRIVRGLKGGSQARVIQGEQARRDAAKITTLPTDSIIGVMSFSHATAGHYLRASYGQVQRVASAEMLRHTRRGVTCDGMGSGNYALFRCDLADTDLVFGQGARVRALQAKQQELAQLQREWQGAADSAGECQQLLRSIDQLKPSAYADHLQELLELQRQLQRTEASLQQLDCSDFQDLEQRQHRLRADEEQHQQHLQTLGNQRVELLAEQRNVDSRCRQLDSAQSATLTLLDACADNLQSLTRLWPDFDAEACLTAADSQADARDLHWFDGQTQALEGELNSRLHRLQALLLQHNQLCHGADAVAFEPTFNDTLGRANFTAICGLQRQLDSIYNRYKNNILAVRHAELAALRASFNNAFVTNLCHSIYQAINDGKQLLEQLNRELEHHRFGADRERFRFGWDWVPEFRDYWQFFKAVIDNPSLGDGQTLFDMPLDKKQVQVRDRLLSMLLDDDENRALRELARIADYRNYRRYEIYKEPEGKAPIALSQYGTGSGGQLETPAYIIRSAAITSAFRFNEGKSHLRMVLVDEAFSKMDEHRSKEVINYLTESLGLQLMFIMPSSKSGPFMDLISNQFVFSKCPTTTPVGELHTRVLVDRQQCDKEKIARLMANHRRTIRQQAALDFLDEVEA